MSDRILTRADDAPGHNGIWDEITIERSAAGAPGLMFIMSRYEDGFKIDQMCVSLPDGATFLAPVNAWLGGNDPEPWVLPDGSRDSNRLQHPYIDGHIGPRRDFGAQFAPRPVHMVGRYLLG